MPRVALANSNPIIACIDIQCSSVNYQVTLAGNGKEVVAVTVFDNQEVARLSAVPLDEHLHLVGVAVYG